MDFYWIVTIWLIQGEPIKLKLVFGRNDIICAVFQIHEEIPSGESWLSTSHLHTPTHTETAETSVSKSSLEEGLKGHYIYFME